MTLKLHRDETQRVVNFHITGEQPIPPYASARGVYIHPDILEFKFIDGKLVSCAVRGQRTTRDGGRHNSAWGSRLWPPQRTASKRPVPWDPDYWPQFVIDALAEIGYDRDGNPL